MQWLNIYIWFNLNKQTHPPSHIWIRNMDYDQTAGEKTDKYPERNAKVVARIFPTTSNGDARAQDGKYNTENQKDKISVCNQ